MLPRRSLVVLAALLSVVLLGHRCPIEAPPETEILLPNDAGLFAVGPVDVKIHLPSDAAAEGLRVELDGADVTALLKRNDTVVYGELPLEGEGWHELRVSTPLAGGGSSQDLSRFEAVDLERPEVCEVLNGVHCLYPFPSSQFLKPDPSKPSGLRMEIPDFAVQFPGLVGPPPTGQQFLALDGFSPTVAIQMHFPGGVDLVASGAPRLIPPEIGNPTPPPYVGIRMGDERSLEGDSPTVLIRAATGERVLHFVELDARAAGNPDRQALIMRASQSLIPGERYIVAVRGLVHPGGAAVLPEPAFSAIRDRRATNVPGLFHKRKRFEEEIFPVLRDAGVAREDLILAWDFQVQSDEGLTHHALDMREMSFDWLAQQTALDVQTFQVDSVEEAPGACDDGEGVWRIVRGTYQVPLFLTEDPEIDANSVGFLNVDAADDPVVNGTTNPVFTISIPCASQGDTGSVHPVVIGHGLFGTGEGMITALAQGLGLDVDVIAGATDWRGLSSRDLGFVITEVVGVASLGGNKFEQFPALPDRLKQGQINTVLLARMMKQGVFNRDPAFQRPDGSGVFPGADTEMFYYGISLGGIMGTWFAAMTPDLERLNVDVPAMNFAMLLQRSTQFGQFELLLTGIGLTDPIFTLLTLSLNHEVWVRSEPAGYVRHITSDPLPGTNPKKLLVTMAWLDKQVSNQATEIMVRSLGIPNLTGSVQQGFPGIPDVDGPVDSALVVWDTGSYDIFLPAHYATVGSGPLIPPLANRIPSSKCDPHAARLTIPASLDQLAAFLRPGGQVENTCEGICDAAIPYERPGGAETSCDPLN
jgi:hypothetical protein